MVDRSPGSNVQCFKCWPDSAISSPETNRTAPDCTELLRFTTDFSVSLMLSMAWFWRSMESCTANVSVIIFRDFSSACLVSGTKPINSLVNNKQMVSITSPTLSLVEGDPKNAFICRRIAATTSIISSPHHQKYLPPDCPFYRLQYRLRPLYLSTLYVFWLPPQVWEADPAVSIMEQRT